MKSILALVSVLLFLASRGLTDDQTDSVRYTFAAEVLSIDIAQKTQPGPDVHTYCYDPKEIAEARDGRIVVGMDANWSIQTIIRRTGSDSGPFPIGAKVEFIVHSPTHAFLGRKEEVVGKVVEITLEGSRCKDASVSFSRLTGTMQKDGEPGATDNPGNAQ